MSTEWFAAVALPVSVATDAGAHASVFIAPTLLPDHEGAVLREFDLFRTWGDVVAAGLSVTLVDQRGEFEAQVDLTGFDPSLWKKAFGDRTPVRANDVPAWQSRDWRTFAAKDCSDIAKGVHLATIAADPVAPVTPMAHPLTAPILEVALQSEALTFDDVRGHRDPVPTYDESRLTRVLDDSLQRGIEGAWTTPEEGPAGTGDDHAGSVLEALQQLHLVRRFYERPESQVAEQRVHNPLEKVALLPSPTPEFHERVAAAGDHPTFLRRLGLLLPVRSDPRRLRRSRWLAAVVRTRGPAGSCRSPRLAVRALRDDSFVSVPNPDDPRIWVDGALTLGDHSIFDVIDVDPDGSAIKAERFLTTIPRLAIAQFQKAPADAASPALRASGLTVTRRRQAGRAANQLERQEAHRTALGKPGQPDSMPLLHTQDVTRGLRVEVWDSVSRDWHSLHSRRSTLIVEGEPVYAAEPGEGFIQGTSATETRGVDDGAIHVHEAMFGWEGWSLSVPRPGKRVRPELSDAPGGGTRITETVEPTPSTPQGAEKPPHPFVFTHEYAQGTLPRLRFGRDYSFRAWAVDLGGQVRPHQVGPRPPVLADAVAAASRVAPLSDRTLSRLVASASAHDARTVASGFAATISASTTAGVTRGSDLLTPDAGGTVGGDTAGERPERAGDRILDALSPAALHTVVLGAGLDRSAADALSSDDAATSRLRDLGVRGATVRRRIADPPAPPPGIRSRTSAVGAAFRRAGSAGAVARSPISTDLETARELIAGHLADTFAGMRSPTFTGPMGRAAVSTVTPPRPFLRWDPVPPPVVVPLKAFTEGESLRVVVVRSGVTQDPESLTVSTQDPATYAASVAGVAPLYAGSSRRHLAPPKTSQGQAELHGAFDAGIDEGTPQARRQMLAWALREGGTFYDRSVPHPSDPVGAPAAQPGVHLLPEPVGGDHFNPSDPKRPLKVLPPSPNTPEELVLHPGDAPAPGQYVVHDTPALALPYLPDPLAVGVSLAFTEAGAGRHVAFPWGAEQVTARFPGDWPEREPFLLTLGGGSQLGARIDGRDIDAAHESGGDEQVA